MSERYIDGSDNKNIYNLLCNLSSKEDSIILNEISNEKKSFEEDRARTKKSIATLKDKLKIEMDNLNDLNEGLVYSINWFQSYDENLALQKCFSLLNVDGSFLDATKRAVEEELDTHTLENNTTNEINKLKADIEVLENDLTELDSLIVKNDELFNSTIVTTEDLYYLIDGAVNGNGSFNKDYVSGLLKPLMDISKKYEIIFQDNFMEVASKAIFFPDDGLNDRVIEYANGIDREVKYLEDVSDKNYIEEVTDYDNIMESDVSAEDFDEIAINDIEENTLGELDLGTQGETEEQEVETEAETEAVEEVSTETVAEENVSIVDELQDELVSNVIPSDISIPFIEDNELNIADNVVPVDNEEVTISGEKEEVKDDLKFDTSKCSPELKALIDSTPTDVVNKNVDELKIMNLESEYYYYENGYSYLCDPDLSKKLNLLRSNRLNDKIIVGALKCHYISSSYAELEEKIKLIASKDKFSSSYLPLLKEDVNKYFDVLDELNGYGIELSDQEKLQYMTIIANSADNVVPDTEILKDYGISLLRKNGKYELGLYVKKPKYLVESIDNIVEMGEESLLNTVPDVLKDNTEYIIRIINYLKDNNIDYKEGDTYSEIVYKPLAFKEAYPNANLDELEMVEDSNKELAEALNNDYCNVLMQILDKYYESDNCYKIVELKEEEKEVVDKLKEEFENNMGAQLVGKNTYKINDTYVSRNKFERNLYFLVSGLMSKEQDVMSMSREVLLVSALFNSRKTKGKKVSLPNLGDDLEISMGGKAA